MEWLTERAKESVGSLHHALKGVEKDVPQKAAVPFASLLTALLAVLQAVDAFLAALRSKDDDAPPKNRDVPPGLAIEDEEDTLDLHTPPRR